MIKYLGSKRLLVPRILACVRALPDVRRVLDLFSGTSRVASANGLAKRGVTSLGFSRMADPAASAGLASISASVSGTFHGLMTPTSG